MLENEEDGLFTGVREKVATQLMRNFFPKLHDVVYFTVFTVTPQVPRSVWLNFRSLDMGRLLVSVYLQTLFFTLIMNMVLSWSTGTLFADGNPQTVNFFEDYVNIFLYVFVCPAYVALSFGMLGLAADFWSRHAEESAKEIGVPQGLAKWRLALSLFIVLLGSSIAISQYQYDILLNPLMKYQYWFVGQDNGFFFLNRSGFYYIIMNFVLLCISALGALAFLSIVLKAVKDARRIDDEKIIDANEIVSRFRPFVTAVVLARLLTFCYMLNVIVWSYSKLGEATLINVAATAALIAIVGVAGINFPKRFVDRQIATARGNLAGREGVANLHLIAEAPLFLRRASNSIAALIGFGFLGLIFQVFDPTDHIKLFLAWLSA